MSWQRFDTPWVNALHLNGQGVFGATRVIPFRFQCPGPRVMLTIKMIVRQVFDATSSPFGTHTNSPPTGNGGIFDWTFGNGVTWSIWLAKTIKAESGVRIPVQNLLGTRANPVTVSTYDNIGLGTLNSTDGFAFDVNVGGDGVDGEITFVPTGVEPDPGWEMALKGRYNAISKICDREWKELAAAWPGSPAVIEQTVSF